MNSKAMLQTHRDKSSEPVQCTLSASTYRQKHPELSNFASHYQNNAKLLPHRNNSNQIIRWSLKSAG